MLALIVINASIAIRNKAHSSMLRKAKGNFGDVCTDNAGCEGETTCIEGKCGCTTSRVDQTNKCAPEPTIEKQATQGEGKAEGDGSDIITDAEKKIDDSESPIANSKDEPTAVPQAKKLKQTGAEAVASGDSSPVPDQGETQPEKRGRPKVTADADDATTSESSSA